MWDRVVCKCHRALSPVPFPGWGEPKGCLSLVTLMACIQRSGQEEEEKDHSGSVID